MKMSGSISSIDGELNAIVKEYLEYIQLEEVSHLFEKECLKIGKPIQELSKDSRNDKISKTQNDLLTIFDLGNRSDFFNIWESAISEETRETSLECQKLEFQLQLHFAIAPLRKKDEWMSDESTEAMFYLRYYLETKGSNLSHLPDILPYFALPYVHDPQDHPSFKDLFDEFWVTELRSNLETFIWKSMKETNAAQYQPQLVQLYNASNQAFEDAQRELKSTESSLEDAEKLCKLKTRQLIRLQEDHQKLMLVAADLVLAVESAVKGDLQNIANLLGQASSRFPELFQLQNEPESRPLVESSSISSSTFSLAQQMKNFLHKQSLEVVDPILVTLDFEKIKRDLVILEPRSKALLLQALRWRLTKANSEEQKEIVLSTYISNDILGCQKPSMFWQQIAQLVKSNNKTLLQSLSRFLNAIASFQKGRSYLSLCPDLLLSLQDHVLQSKNSDSVTRNMMLGVLQKLSLRRNLQLNMIEKGMIEWLVFTLERVKELDSYCLEYSTALLMNLCLTVSGRNVCKTMLNRVLHLFINLLNFNNVEILPYVNGGLFSLLTDSEIRKKAQEMNLEDALEKAKSQMNLDSSRQVDYVLKKLHSDDKDESESNDEDGDDEDEEEIEIEPEIDCDDPVISSQNEIAGEKLLSSHYMNIKILTTKQLNHISKKYSQDLNSQNEDKKSSKQPKFDAVATELVRRLTGEPSKVIIQAATLANPGAYNVDGIHAQEFALAFSSRPKIRRSPEPEDTATSSHGGGSRSPYTDYSPVESSNASPLHSPKHT